MTIALDRGLALLRRLAAGPAGFGTLLSDLDLHRPGLWRLLRHLEQAGWIERDGSGRWRTAAAARRLGRDLQGGVTDDELALAVRVRPPLEALRAETGQSVMAVHWDGHGTMRCVVRLTHPDALPLLAEGERHEWFGDHPWGWVCAFASADPIHLLLRRRELFPRWQGRSLPLLLRRERARLAEAGWVLHRHRLRHRLAAPIRSADGVLNGVVVVGGNPLTLPQRRIVGVAERLRACARACAVR